MQAPLDTKHTRSQAGKFWLKSRILQARRTLLNLPSGLKRFSKTTHSPPERAAHRSFLWHIDHPAELDLAAGKVQNLRLACRLLDGLHIPAGQTFSFWKQIGRTSRRRGFTTGRELREGCIVPNIGGGLCQLSNGLYDLALQCGFTINERHAHTRVIAGSLAEKGRDATVFWNYVDLRFTAPVDYVLRASLSKDHLILKVCAAGELSPSEQTPESLQQPDSLGNCLTCNHATCFRSQPTSAASMTFGRKAFLLDAHWPEHDTWCRSQQDDSSVAFLPLDGSRRHKPNYAWTLDRPREAALTVTARRSWAMRTISAQGAERQKLLLKFDRLLARAYHRQLDHRVQHLTISQSLLPHLAEIGTLGGRTFDVLMTRWPLEALHDRLNEAASTHPESTTLTDFRAPKDLLAAESRALAAATRLVTPHHALAQDLRTRFPNTEVIQLDWHLPRAPPSEFNLQSSEFKIQRAFFPASPLARKGVFELAAWAKENNIELHILGRATENETNPLSECHWHQATPADLSTCDAVVLPAYVENQPRLLLQALAQGIPVIASTACGIPPRPGLTLLEHPGSLTTLPKIPSKRPNSP
ncbi:MAG: VanW family protein [Verrucomicrobiaceae bacterium]